MSEYSIQISYIYLFFHRKSKIKNHFHSKILFQAKKKKFLFIIYAKFIIKKKTSLISFNHKIRILVHAFVCMHILYYILQNLYEGKILQL